MPKPCEPTYPRWVVAVFTTVVLSGCYSGGQWSTPNLAFWKSNPFQSTPGATPGGVGSAVKPSGLAASPSATAPSVSYGSPKSGDAATASNTPSTSPGYNTPPTGYPGTYRRLQLPRRRLLDAQNPRHFGHVAGRCRGRGRHQATARPPTTRAPPAYRAQGLRHLAACYGGSGGSYGGASTPSASPYGGTTPYSNPVTPSYSTPPSGGAYNSAGSSTGGYVPAGTSAGGYANPVRPAAAYSDSPPLWRGQRRTAAATGRGMTLLRYGDAASGSSGPSGTDPAAPAGDRFAPPSDRYSPPSTGSAPLPGSRYGWPATVPPTAGSGGYSPPPAPGFTRPELHRQARPARVIPLRAHGQSGARGKPLCSACRRQQ